jgi:hypothetical protein
MYGTLTSELGKLTDMRTLIVEYPSLRYRRALTFFVFSQFLFVFSLAGWLFLNTNGIEGSLVTQLGLLTNLGRPDE